MFGFDNSNPPKLGFCLIVWLLLYLLSKSLHFTLKISEMHNRVCICDGRPMYTCTLTRRTENGYDWSLFSDETDESGDSRPSPVPLVNKLEGLILYSYSLASS